MSVSATPDITDPSSLILGLFFTIQELFLDHQRSCRDALEGSQGMADLRRQHRRRKDHHLVAVMQSSPEKSTSKCTFILKAGVDRATVGC
jgi:hypothetical protein